LQNPRIDHDSQIFVYEYLGKELEDNFGAAALTEFGRLSLLMFKPRAYREAWRGMEGPIAGMEKSAKIVLEESRQPPAYFRFFTDHRRFGPFVIPQNRSSLI